MIDIDVSMPSRAYTSFLQRRIRSNRDGRMGVNALSGLSCYALAGGIALSSTAFQCPLGLITHFYVVKICNKANINVGFNALSGL